MKWSELKMIIQFYFILLECIYYLFIYLFLFCFEKKTNNVIYANWIKNGNPFKNITSPHSKIEIIKLKKKKKKNKIKKNGKSNKISFYFNLK